MSHPDVSRRRSRALGRRTLPLLALLLAVVALTAAAGPAAAEDTTAPEWGNATKGNATTINVTIYDDGELDTGSIALDDFVTSAGTVENVTVDSLAVNETNRTGARVSLHLSDPLNEDNVTIGLRSGASITDTAGNELPAETVTATGMDTITPRYRSFETRRVNASTVEIVAETNERLRGLSLSIAGPEIDTLNRSDFTERVDGTVTYTARYTFTEEGEYSLLWLNATDRNGNSIRFSRQATFQYDSAAPNVTLVGPSNATVGESVNFSAENASDEQGVESIRWRIDGGTILTGERITIAFATRGTHEVVVEARDPLDNVAEVTRRVTVTGDGDAAVTVTRPNATHASATVEGTGRSQRVQSVDGPLLTGRNASLRRFRAEFPANTTVPVSLRARNRTPPSFATATGDVGLLRFDVDHGQASVGSVTFTVAVDRAALDAVGADPKDVTLYRDEGGWTPLETTVVTRTESRVVYQASSPGLSTFVVGAGGADEPSDESGDDGETTDERTDGTETASADSAASGSPDIRLTNATAVPSNASVGQQVVVTVELENRGTATGDHLVALYLNGSALTTRTVTVPAGETRTTEFARELPESGTLEVGTRRVANVSGGGGGVLLPTGSLPALSIPNPLALWPSGLLGTALAVFLGLVGSVYVALKALAIYLGY